ncbi:MAG TPA: VTT domain-containing protein [Gemmataceae bacterium]|nr:VTT domain-containing protein [Gemmataceae bacterium]
MLPIRQYRRLRLAFLGLLAFCLLAAFAQSALASDAADGGEQQNFFMQVLHNLITFNSSGLMKALGRQDATIAAFVVLNIIVFVETGLLVGFFLPGDSLLVTAGLIASNDNCGWSLPLLLATLCLSAIVGDTVGYTIGFKTGPKIFCREKSFFFNKDHLLKAQAFYELHGGKTIILARFMPILRTFAPVVAGVGQMRYRSFIVFNIVGGIGWVCSMVLCGYFLPTLLNPVLEPVFGRGFKVEEHVEKVVIVVVLLSIAPGIVVWLKNKAKKKKGEVKESEPLAA